jgi:hypothetical protein
VKWRRELNPVNFLLLAGIAFLLVAIIRIWWDGESLAFRSPSAKGPEVPMAPLLRDQQPLSAFGTVSAKNLFSQDRSGPALGPGKVQNNLEGHHLVGTMIIGDTRVALIGGKAPMRGKGKVEVEVIYLGQEWGGYKLVEISNDAVVFQGKEGRKTINFPE